jgi:cytochrome oxidase Cu insertion factor (SCO1/SenC/PrrC family)
LRFIAALAALCVLDAHAAQGDERVTFPQQLFTPPPASSYSLPPIQPAARGRVLDESGRERPLSGYLDGRITLLSFVYTHCTDPAGCPLAFATLAAVRDRLSAHPVAAQAQLVSLSFDPEYDTPDVMRMFSKSFDAQGKKPAWHFLTTASDARLAPLLAGFGQDAATSSVPGGPRRLDHTLRVFLIDARSRVREIYSSAYLMPEVIVNDILTLAAERRMR